MGWEFKMCEKHMPNSQMRYGTLYLLQYVLLLFSYLIFSSLLSSNCSCFCLTWRLSFSIEEKCYLKGKRNYCGALGLRHRWSTLFAHLRNSMSDPTSSLSTVSSMVRVLNLEWLMPADSRYIYICMKRKKKFLVLVCGLLLHGFLLGGGVYTAQTSQ